MKKITLCFITLLVTCCMWQTTAQYMVDQAGVFAPADLSAGATAITLGDDAGSAPIPMGFTFTFFGVDYTNIHIASNGYLTFDSTDLTDLSEDVIPSTTTPNAIIAVAWDDLNPAQVGAGTIIRYRTDGTPGNRIFIMEYVNLTHFGSSPVEPAMTAQVKLFEGSNDIELHGTSYTADNSGTDSWVQGIENADGTMGLATPGRNGVNWNATNDYVRFFIPGPPPPMADPIYYTSRTGSIFMANRDGTGSSTIYTGATAEPIGLEVDPINGNLYYAGGNTSDIFTAPLDGSGPITAIPSLSSGNEHHEFEIDYDTGLVYYTSDNGGLWVGNLDGTGTSTNLVPTRVNSGVTLDKTNGILYYNSDQSNIGRVNIDGTGLNSTFIATNGNSRGVTLDEENGFIFWVERGSNLVKRANTDGTGTITLYPAGDAPYGIDYDPEDGLLYWTTFAGFSTPGSVWVAPADGSGTPTILYSGITGLRGIAAGRNMRRQNAGTPPIMNCPGDITLNASPGECEAPYGFATPVALDPEGGSVTVTQTMGAASPGPYPVGTTIIEFTATNDDAPNETTTCQFTITVVDNQAPTIACPADITQTNDPTLCGADVTIPAPTIMDNCPVVPNNPPPSASSPETAFIYDTFGLADTPTTITGTQMSTGGDVTMTANYDGDFGFSSESFTLQAPDGVTIIYTNSAQAGPDCTTFYSENFTIPEADWNNYVSTFGPDLTFTLLADGDVDDFCADGSYQLSVVQGDVSATSILVNDYNGTNDASDFYPVGTTTVTWTYTDGGGNSASCTMDVTVTDDEAPEIVCVGGAMPASGATSASPGLAIPDGDPTGITTTMDVTDDFDITDLNVDIDISHTWVGDLTVSLTAPDGVTTAVLIDRPGVPASTFGCDGTDIQATLDDEAATPVEDECGGGVPTIAGSFIPNEALSVFDGMSTVGTWTLFLSDSATPDPGVLNSWSLNYDYLATTSPPLEVFLDEDGMALVPASMFVSMATDNCSIATIEVVDGVNLPTIDQCGDNVGGAISSTLPPTESVTNVAEAGVIGADYTLDNVEIDITHTFDGDLEIELISPAGTPLMLSDNNGGSGNDFIDTVFMDGGADINSGSAPFTGTFEPEGGTFAATFDGEAITGDWTLRVTDTFGGDDGTLDSFCISFVPINPSQALFTCDDVGNTTVDIIVTDTSGNTAMCTASVLVIDNIDPILVCQDFTLELGPDGTAMLDPMDLIDMANTIEACGISVDAVSEDDFDCDDIGTPQMITLFVSDPSGNLASCVATVTVVDLLGPEVTCPADMTIDPGANNQLYEVPDYFADGLASATDNCTDPVTVFAQDPAAGSFLGDGVYTVTLSAFDEYGNEGTCTFELTIESILGAEDNTLDAGVTLYPNPAQNQVILSNASNILLTKATMYDVNGKLVSTIDLSNMTTEKTIDISQLASGVYIVQIEGDNASVVKRLIKE